MSRSTILFGAFWPIITLAFEIHPKVQFGGSPFIRNEHSCLIWVSSEIDRRPCPAIVLELSRACNIPFAEYDEKLGHLTDLLEALSDILRPLRRNTLLISGNTLEGAVTRSALSALMEGYEVFIVSDWCGTLESENRRFFEDRIIRHGGVFVSSRQMLDELSIQCTADYDRKKLLHIIASLKHQGI